MKKDRDTGEMEDIYLMGACVGLSEGLACLNNFVCGVVALKQIMHCKQLPKVITKLWDYFLLVEKRRAGGIPQPKSLAWA